LASTFGSTGVVLRFMRLPGLSSVAVSLLVSSAKIVAQDALRSALSLEPVLRPQPDVPLEISRVKSHLGPVALNLGTYAGLELNDNVNSSELDPRADFVSRAGLSFGLSWPVTDSSELRFGSNAGYVHYLRNPQYDHLEVAPNSALSWAIGLPEGRIALFDQFSYSQQVLAEPAISGLATFPRLNNTIGASATWLPERWVLATSYAHNESFSDSSQFTYLNSGSEYFFLRAGFRFGALSQAGLEASSSLTRYELSTQNDNHSVSFGPYADWQITEWIHASLRGGGVFYVFDSRPSSSQGTDLQQYYFGLEADHRLTDYLTHKISIQRDVRQGLNQGSSYIQELSASYSISYSLSSKISLETAINFERGNQPFEVFVNVFPFGTFAVLSTEDYTRYGGTLSASWRATEKLVASVTYSRWLRDSSLKDLGYQVNSVLFNFSYAF
jgi:hypothetical protein